jgi:hypothetical protein
MQLQREKRGWAEFLLRDYHESELRTHPSGRQFCARDELT